MSLGTISKTNLPLGTKRVGKVRDVYTLPEKSDQVVMVATDRISAFDLNLTTIPHKGHVLTKLTQWWFNKTEHIADNHLMSSAGSNSLICKKCTVFPIEFVVRGYMTGTTGTSIWTHYNKGARSYCGHKLPDGLKKNQPLPEPIVTPTTKSDIHDELISAEIIINKGIMSKHDYNFCSQKALELFKFGVSVAHRRGLILVDTKYEFGQDSDGNILLIDEIHTCDSSRYWVSNTYQQLFNDGKEPQRYDKDILRTWYKSKANPYTDTKTIEIPDEIRLKLSEAYIHLYEQLTEHNFIPTDRQFECFNRLPIIVMGSVKDKSHAKKIQERLAKKWGKPTQIYVASAHKHPRKVLDIIDECKRQKVTFVTIAGRSNALSGFIAANSHAPVLACPPFKDQADYLVNIHSTLQMPSETPAMAVIDPINCADAAGRIMNM